MALQRPPEKLHTNSPMCPSCSVRWVVGEPTGEPPAELFVSSHLPSTLAKFAREFDEASDGLDETFTAVDFIDWLTPSLRPRGSKRPSIRRS